MNFEPLGNSAPTVNFLALGKTLKSSLRSLMNCRKLCRTKNGALRISSISWTFSLQRVPIQNHSKPPITEKR